ncbi:MAG: C40 family peptidase [Gordonia polyisoprenivorans]|nr:C40 family peptidase [Gordonia polyisoprenivorans]
MSLASVVVAAVTVVGAGSAGAQPPPGPTGTIAALITEIARTDQRVADLDALVAQRREAVNRSLVDLQNARDAERVAASAASDARRVRESAARAVGDAQKVFDALIDARFRQGDSLGAAGWLLSPDGQSMLDRSAVIEQVAREQRGVVTELLRRREDSDNRVRVATTTAGMARAAAATSARQKAAAVASLAQASDAVGKQRSQRATLLARRAQAAAELAVLRPRVPAAEEGAAPTSTPTSTAPTNSIPGSAVPGPPSAALGGAGSSGPVTPSADVAATVRTAVEALAKDVVQKAIATAIAAISPPHTDIDGDQRSTPPSATAPNTSTAPAAPSAPLPAPSSGPAAVETVVNRALSQLGVPYSWGGGNASGPTVGVRDGGVADSFGDYAKVGFDCSGLMMYAFAGVGLSLPHYTGYQYTAGRQVPLAEMRRGDIIFYGPNASQHNAMILGDGTMIEAPQSGDVVKISPVRTSGAMPYVVRLV